MQEAVKVPLHLVRADARRGQKRASDPRRLELEAVNLRKWALALNLVLPKSSKGSSLLSLLSSPMEKCFRIPRTVTQDWRKIHAFHLRLLWKLSPRIFFYLILSNENSHPFRKSHSDPSSLPWSLCPANCKQDIQSEAPLTPATKQCWLSKPALLKLLLLN